MTTLSSSDRSRLEKAVLAARTAAETGVRKRFAALDLAGADAPTGMSTDDRTLRNALRARARDLGRGRGDANLGNMAAISAGVPFLVEELAYEAWHRMLFARFLAENDLLVHPEYGVTLSVDDVRELAGDTGDDPWELAASLAADRLPGLFHLKTPLRLPTEDRQDLARILGRLEPALFTATDALGWVYQFWQSRKKDEVNASGEKITGATLPAVTQLFTEDYIVDFLLQNSLGAWYVSRYPDTGLREQWDYLRYRDDDTPSAGTFESWPKTVAEVTVMDPCCGSGHFLVAAFHMLVQMRQEQEWLSASEAADAVLRDNLFGLELDARCTQIATFAVALEAWKLGGHPETNLPHIACSGIPVAGQKAQWVKLAKGDDTLANTLEQLHDMFAQAGELGSLIDPRAAIGIGDLWKLRWEDVERQLHVALEREDAADPAAQVFALVDSDVMGTVRAANLLARRYTLVATNVPYKKSGEQSKEINEYAELNYVESRFDIATMFLERCLAFAAPDRSRDHTATSAGSVALILPQNWLFLRSYQRMRKSLLVRQSFSFLIVLGAGGFRSSQAAGAYTALCVMSAEAPDVESQFAAIDASTPAKPDQKADAIRNQYVLGFNQQRQMENVDNRILLTEASSGALLEKHAWAFKGLETGDRPRFSCNFWELCGLHGGWEKLQSTVAGSILYGGREHLVLWQDGNGAMAMYRSRLAAARGNKRGWKHGIAAWTRHGVVVSLMGNLPVTLYNGDIFDNNCAVVVPNDPNNLPAIWAFCNSPEFYTGVGKIDPALKVTNASLVKVPFDLERWQKVAGEQYPDGLPEPYSSDPTQWLFDGTVPGSDYPLHVAMARLLGYRWPEQVDDNLDQLADPDGIVCLPSVYQEPAAHIRLRELLRTAYGGDWSDTTLNKLLREVDAPSLEAWLRSRKGFFAQHVKHFHNRPFLWQITDGHKDGFAAVVNYHRLTAGTFRKLIYTYLDDWIGRQRTAIARDEPGAQGRLDAATGLRAKLLAIYAGEPPYDIYVRWNSLAEQPIGWEPDLDDGVRLNIRSFIEAGVLAAKVNVKWGKDRGKDPEVRDEPLLREATGDLRERIERHVSVDRHNDLHFTRKEKKQARELTKVAEGLPA